MVWVRTFGATLRGIDAIRVTVEVDAGLGLPSFHIVGQADRVVNESRDRVRAAFRQSGLEFPPGRVTANLAPTEVPKVGSALDLAIAVGIAATRVALDPERLEGTLLLGELGLDGRVHGVRGALAMLCSAAGAAIVPAANGAETAGVPGLDVSTCEALDEVVAYLRGDGALDRVREERAAPPAEPEIDLADVRGQASARRALELAAAGGHNLLMVGPPGSGKTLLARRLPGLLPPLPFDTALVASRIHSVAGVLGESGRLRHPPFRAPHHTTSEIGLVGGGRPIRPGEISLAHAGVLFLDELPEFRRTALEALRQPLEEGRVSITRASGSVSFPANFQLVGAMNPCPCGFHGHPTKPCRCTDADLARYLQKLSGPLLDRIDLQVAVAPVPIADLRATRSAGESSAAVRARVEAARARQAERLAGSPHPHNAALPGTRVLRGDDLRPGATRLLERAVDRMGLSIRGYVRVLRVARSVADLADTTLIEADHVAEALHFRTLEGGGGG